jgi:glycosyltransferase involved in cell wall biosynthesis
MVSVSVAMATFNGGRYIGQQLESLAAQSYLPSELIVSDDGSTDETLEVVNDFTVKAPFPVSVNRNRTRLGYRGNFLYAASLCSSDLVAFCDQDDVWDHRKIEICVPFFDNPDVLLTYHNATAITAGGQIIGALDHCAAPKAINPPLTIGPWAIGHGFTQLFRRSLPFLPNLWATSVDHWNVGEQMAHDQWFSFSAPRSAKLPT